jgi:hypothetical protein
MLVLILALLLVLVLILDCRGEDHLSAPCGFRGLRAPQDGSLYPGRVLALRLATSRRRAVDHGCPIGHGCLLGRWCREAWSHACDVRRIKTWSRMRRRDAHSQS